MRVETPDGRPYFQNVALGLTQWEPPKQTEVTPISPVLAPSSPSAVYFNDYFVVTFYFILASAWLDACRGR